ncbi:MAG: glycosyltransferase [Blastococcus sp.]
MRALMIASPLVGHVLPLIPLARELQRAGHEVVLATGGEGLAAARSSGLDARDVAPGVRAGAVFGPLLLSHPLLMRREIAGRAGTDAVGLMFARMTRRMLPGVLALADSWRPHLVVHEPLAAAGALAAARSDLPAVTVDASLFDAAELLAAVGAELRSTLRRYGLQRLPAPAEMLVTTPPSLAGRRHGRQMRYVPVAGEGDAPEVLTRRGDRPRILVSRSTVDSPIGDRLMERVVVAASRAAVDVVLVRPDPRVVRRALPENVRTTGWLPFPPVFAAADAVVHHGGAGTLLTALAAGLPQLVVPGAGDRTVNADLVAARGAGLAVAAERITAEDLERLVSDPGLVRAAREVADEIRRMPAPADMVGALTALVR